MECHKGFERCSHMCSWGDESQPQLLPVIQVVQVSPLEKLIQVDMSNVGSLC